MKESDPIDSGSRATSGGTYEGELRTALIVTIDLNEGDILYGDITCTERAIYYTVH